jgi:hyperosmotically inducible protein
MRTLFRLLLLIAVIVGVFWLLQQRNFDRVTREAKAEVGSAVRGAREAVEDLDTPRIAEELKRTGQVVRRKAVKAAHKVAEATEDARTTASIKGRLALDPELSALEISVDTTDGRVTLAGRVDSPEHVARAMRLALEESNVQEVVSTLQVRAPHDKKVTQLP